MNDAPPPPDKLNHFLNRAKGYLSRRAGIYYQRSYAQCGEDIIIKYIFDALKIPKPRYVDIGAHHPHFLSNTYLFYRNGCRGANIEPDPSLVARFQRARGGDINLNMGLAGTSGELTLNIMSSRTMNTFDRDEAESLTTQGFTIVETVPVPVMTYPEMAAKHLDFKPDFISLDVEGLDMEILETIDFADHSPTVFCIETISYSNSGLGEKDSKIDDLMKSHGYVQYADTMINTIYVMRDRWERNM